MFKKTQTLEQMQAAGWDFSPPRPCSKCGEPISWASNPTTGKNYSFDAFTPNYHWKHCAGNEQAGAQHPSATTARTPAGSAATATPPAPATAPNELQAAVTPAPAANELQATVAELAAAVKGLTAELARRTPASPAPARRYDENGCPTDR